jgi:flagellar M-ring protein FliF
MATEEPADTRSWRQITLVVMAAVIGAILLFALWYLFLRTPYAPAFTGLKSNDAVTITGELDRLKTPYRLAEDGTTILVPEDRVDMARINVLGGDLPLKGAVGFELFNKTDMGLTEFAQKINYQRALQGELARTIMALEQVETARVHLSLPESGIFDKDRRAAKAAVTIATKQGGALENTIVRGVQQLVASAVPELQAANVAVLDARGELLSEAPSALVPAVTPELQEQQALEQIYAAKIRAAVSAAGLSMPLSVSVHASQAFGSGMVHTGKSPGDEKSTDSTQPRAPLQIVIGMATEPGQAVREQVLTIARQAIIFDQTRGDAIYVQVDPALASVPKPVMPQPRVDTPAKAEGFAAPEVPLWPFLAALLLVCAIFVIMRLRQGQKPLSGAERDGFATKLKALLDEEGQSANAAR